VKRLNNFVSRLAGPSRILPGQSITAVNPRVGWVFISSAGTGSDAGFVLNGESVTCRRVGRAFETMRYLPEGEFTVAFQDGAEEVIVRTVPQIMHTKYGYNCMIKGYGTYDEDFLREHVLDNINTMVASTCDVPMLDGWKADGGRWVIECPRLHKKDITADEIIEYFLNNANVMHPATDSVLVDEFFSGDDEDYPAWAEALGKLAEHPDFQGKEIFPYCGSHYPHADDFLKYDGNNDANSALHIYNAAFDAGWKVAWERYLQERQWEDVAESYIDDRMTDSAAHWNRYYPGAAENLVVVLGYMTSGFSLDAHPETDWKYYLDMQFHRLANDGVFDGLAGITGWTSGYADEECLRWASRLYRHYCIEGNTAMLSEKYGFTHTPGIIRNADFSVSWEGWDFPMHMWNTSRVTSTPGYSRLQGRWNDTPVGDTHLVMKRDASHENVISQQMRNLEPGKCYSVRFISADYGDLVSGRSVEKTLPVELRIEGGEVIPDESFSVTLASHGTVTFGPYNRQHSFWTNYHNVVFRATADAGRLSLSDWPKGVCPEAEIGQETMLNFVQVQPWLEK
jgi:hypothetical protein